MSEHHNAYHFDIEINSLILPHLVVYHELDDKRFGWQRLTNLLVNKIRILVYFKIGGKLIQCVHVKVL